MKQVVILDKWIMDKAVQVQYNNSSFGALLLLFRLEKSEKECKSLDILRPEVNLDVVVTSAVDKPSNTRVMDTGMIMVAIQLTVDIFEQIVHKDSAISMKNC